MELIWNKLTNPLKRLSGSNKRETIHDDSTEQYALVTTSQDVLEFEHKKGVALCVGIDRQVHRQYAHKSLGNTVANDAREMGEAFVTKLGFDPDRVKVRVSSAQRDNCTKNGVRALFVESAKMVEENGIFIFYFAGHGIYVKSEYVRGCVLAPADFAGKEDLNSGISGNDLVEWLGVAECKSNHVLVILDCCYAGDLGTTLTSPDLFPDNMLKIKPGLYVMCGCAAREKCTSVGILRHSIFTYFFLDYFKRHQCLGKFAVKQAMEDITASCYNFSSLLVSYNHEVGELRYSEMNPTLSTLDVHIEDVKISTDTDVTDSFKLEVVMDLFEKGRPKTAPHSEVVKWLNSKTTQTALYVLHSKVTASEALQEAILSLMLYSAASIQYAHDKTHLQERNLYLMTVINVLAAIDFSYHDFNATIFHLITGLQYYKEPAKGINTEPLENLFSDMIKKARTTVLDNDCHNNMTATSSDTVNNGDEVDGPVHAAQPNALQKVPISVYNYLGYIYIRFI